MKASDTSHEVTVLASSESEFHFRIDIDLKKLDATTAPDSTLVFSHAVLVGIPFGATVMLTSAQPDSLVPLPSEFKRERLAALSFPPATVSAPITIRHRQFVVVRVYPIVGDYYYRSVTVQLQFQGGEPSTVRKETDPIFDKLFRQIVANDIRSRAWREPLRRSHAAAAPADNPFVGGIPWYKIYVNQTGLYKISGIQLEQAGLSLDNLPSDSLHLFNGGGRVLEVQNSNPRPEFVEVAILVEDGGDGIFDRNDYFVFYGEAVDRWVYEDGVSPRFVNHPYTDKNVYWLTVSGIPTVGKRMPLVSAAPNGTVDTVITAFTRRVHSEQDNILRRLNNGDINDYYTWYWTNDEWLTFFVPAYGVVTGETANVWLTGRTYDNGSPDERGYIDMEVNGIPAFNKTCNRFVCSYQTASLHEGLNEIRLRLWPEVDAPPYFDYMNLEYLSRMVPVNNSLDIPLSAVPFDTARLEIEDGFDAPVMVLDISSPLQPAILTDFSRADGKISLDVGLEPSGVNRFYVGTIQHALGPLAIEQVFPRDLRTASTQADILVLTTSDLVDGLSEYIDYRESNGYSIEVVTVGDVMDNFAYGLYDPTAIRDFLKYAYEFYPPPAPSMALLVGDGTYDFLDHLGTGMKNYVPPYIHPYDESASDDNYVYFGTYGILDSDTSFDTSYVPGDRGYDMLIARLPVRSGEELAAVIAKTKRHESLTDFGVWRTKITLVADDEYGNYQNESFHVTQTEVLEKEHIPSLYQRNKIYLWEYPFVNREKPAVNDAIVKAINDGTLIVNYVGHGNPDVWAHEHVFTRMGDVPRLHNYDYLPLFFTASCAIGFFDDPKREGMAEDLLSLPSGGAVGVISATRLVYATDNALFNQKVFDVLFNYDSLTVGEAVYTAKLLRQYGVSPIPSPKENDRAYLLFGDPCMQLAKPKLSITFSEAPDSLTALAQARVSGQVVDGTGEVYARDGTVIVYVFDSEKNKSHVVGTQTIAYTVAGPSIFRGSATITDGRFSIDFICPLDIGYGGEGARILTYAIFDSTDAAGVVDSLRVTDRVAPRTDSTGPVIIYTFPGRENFVSGDYVGKDDELVITLTDSSGINLTSALGHGITLEIDGQSDNVVNLTDRFEYARDDYTQGSLSYSLEELAPGKHTFKIKAWDNANNSSTVEFEAEVLAQSSLSLMDLLNYPNPMRDSTRFSVYLSQPVEHFFLDIFTLSGRKIKSFGPYSLTAGYFDDIVWKGEDYRGDRVATGVYIYKATAVPERSEKKVEMFGKVIVIN